MKIKNLLPFALFIPMLVLSISTISAQEIAQVQVSGQWLDFNCQTLATRSDYVENPTNLELSKHGGWKAHKVKATGYFRVEKIDDRWWVIDPEGYLYIHKALNSVNLNNHTADEIYQFLDEYGFNGMGSWADEDILKSSLKATTPIAYCPKYSFIAHYRRQRNPRIEMPVFDDAFETFAQSAADYYLPYVDDPHVFGYFSDNELDWKGEGLSAHLEIDDPSDKNYQAAINFLQSRGKTPDNWDTSDRNAYIALMAERYYSIVSSAIKSVDSNHMYIGTRCHSTERFIEDFMINAGKYVDVFSSNRYNRWGERKVELDNMAEWSGRPMIISEFYAMEEIPGNVGAGWVVKSQSDRGPFYQNFVTSFLENKNVVGFHWFKFEDSENGAENKGVVNNDGEPYTELLSYMKELNERIYDFIDHVDSRELPGFTLLPEADAYYKNTTNYGTDPELMVKYSSSNEYTRHIYIRFDLSEVTTPVASAKIRLNSVIEHSESGQYQAELVTDNSWSETGITIENSPAGSKVLASWGVGDDIKIDVTEELIDALSDNQKLSIRIVSTLKNGNIPTYGSREHPNQIARPKLLVYDGASMSDEMEKYDSHKITIYPNPVSNFLQISKKADSIEIIDMAGKTILASNSPANKLDVSELKAGAYILRVLYNKRLHTKLLMK